mmetsp:Transcript_54258/g.129329  ORF Transcript_54258/g.129329 Transcript_54258/m.129329 type:complete len:430 (+) Transcript_54258:89-1378(+)
MASSSGDALQNAVAADQMCRICFEGASEGDLVSPCDCEGSQKYVHLSCLRRWQRSVQLGASNHPEEVRREDRHTRCGVCKAKFNIPPQDRATMMADLAHVSTDEVSPGLLLITSKTSGELNSAVGATEINILFRAYIEAKAQHFRQAVYLLTDVGGTASPSGEDAVYGVNLCRALEVPDVSALEDAASEKVIQKHRQLGIEVLWMNGGPVAPRRVTAIVCVRYMPTDARQRSISQRNLHMVLSGVESVLCGGMTDILAAAAEEVRCATAAGAGVEKPRLVVLAWAGFAQWSRAQLLGELARGSWGWCAGSVDDIRLAEHYRSESEVGIAHPGSIDGLWRTLRHSPRLSWAPDNEFSRDFERRNARVSDRTGRTVDTERDAAAVNVVVRQFEALRRGGGEARARSSSRGAGTGLGAARGVGNGTRSCQQQ